MKRLIISALVITNFFADAMQPDLDRVANSYGRDYYESLVEKASHRHWAIIPTIQYTGASSGFNCDGCSRPLFDTVSGCSTITIRDIYLFSKLSDDNQVRITNSSARACEREEVPLMGKGAVPFGGYRDDLYTTLLAPVQLNFDAKQSEISFIISGMYRYDFARYDSLSLAFGLTIPFKSKKHTLGLTYQNGDLFRPGYIPDTTQRENTLTQFFREYTSVEDFIESAVFNSKGFQYLPTQTKNGVGDISIYGLVEYHNDWSFEIGLQAVFPTGSKGDPGALWSPVLGNGGAFQIWSRSGPSGSRSSR